MDVRQMLDEFYRIWSTGDESHIDDILAEDFRDHCSPIYDVHFKNAELVDVHVGRDAFRRFLHEERTAYPDMTETPLDYVINDRNAVGMYRLVGTHLGPFEGLEPTGRPVDFVGIDWFRITDGRFSDWWYSSQTFDFWFGAGFRAQPVPFS